MRDTIPATLLAAAERDPSKVWLRSDAGSLTFGQAAGMVGRTVQRLRDLGVGRGDLVLVTPRSTPPYLLTWLAITSAGAVAVTANPQGAAGELAGLREQTRPTLVVADPAVALDPAVDVEELVGDWAAGADDALRPEARPDDVAVLIPTSGTTGRSKLVMQTHRAYAWAGQGFPFWLELTADDRLMTSLPLFHVNAPAYSVMGSLSAGAGLVLLERFSASGFLDSARRHVATEFNAIGAMVEILMRQPERPDDADTPLRLCYTGPAPAEQRHLEIERRFGLRVTCGYALSETPYGLVWPRGTRVYGTLGRARQHPEHGEVNRARVVDDEGHDVPPGEVGELLLHNPVITPGYWEMPEQTAQTVVDGWLHTGDLVTGDAEGTYTFVARKKEVLRRRGENLSPLEVEEVLESHHAVAEAAVIGVPSDLSEEEIKAFVVLSAEVALPQLRTWAAERLTKFKVPRYWEAVTELPRTSTLRVAKHRLPTDRTEQEYDATP